MTLVELEDRVTRRLREFAEQSGHTVSDVLEELSESEWAAKDKALDEMAGIFDDDVTDLSSTIRETLVKIYGDQTRDSR